MLLSKTTTLTQVQKDKMSYILKASPGISAADLARLSGVSLSTAKKYRLNPTLLSPETKIRESDVVLSLLESGALGVDLIRKSIQNMAKEVESAERDGKLVAMGTRGLREFSVSITSLLAQARAMKEAPTDLAAILDAAPEELERLLKHYLYLALTEGDGLREALTELGLTPPERDGVPQIGAKLEEIEPPQFDDDEHSVVEEDPLDGYPTDTDKTDGYFEEEDDDETAEDDPGELPGDGTSGD